MRGRLVAVLAAAFVGVLWSGPASAGTGFFAGFSDDAPRWYGSSVTAAARDLGARAMRYTLQWTPGQTAPSTSDANALGSAIRVSSGLRVVLVVYGATAAAAPQDAAARDQYCTYVRSTLQQFPSVNDVEIWIEPNKQGFWKPQFDPAGASVAPARYEALLARCWDVLHAFRPGVDVIGPATSPNGNDNPAAGSNVSHSPGNFLRRLGDAYRASGRTLPILDTVGTHVYGATSAERPWKQHVGQTMIAEGDWNKLLQNLHAAFDGTAQPVPGQCVGGRCVSIWYLEGGFQTTIDAAKTGLYSYAENEAKPVPDAESGETASAPSADSLAPDQATQITDAVRLAACQPYVSAYFNFQLVDDGDLRGWQSGALWADLTQKDSYPAFKSVFGQAAAGSVNCAGLKGGAPSADWQPPETTIDAGPGSTSAAKVSVAFSSSEPGSTFQCALDGGAFAACASPRAYTLASGSHTFKVRAIDGAGNLDATHASSTWTVDATAPETTISAAPPASTTDTTATFQFAASEAGTFACSIDGGAFTACSSPATYAGLAAGSHTFAVRATDAVGNVDTTPATASWTVAQPAGPDTTITSGPGSSTAQTTATFAFTGTDPAGRFECALDAAPLAACTSPVAYSGLAAGAHRFTVRSLDATGAPDPTPAVYDWTVVAAADTTPPDTTITSASTGASASFSFASSEAGSTFACSLDGAASSVCTSPQAYGPLASGTHTFAVRAADAAGNVDPTPATQTWTVGPTPPANDAFAAASSLSGSSGTTTGDTTAATVEPGEPAAVGTNRGGHSVWYRWTAAASGPVAFDTSGSAFDTTLSVYTGTSLTALTKVAEDDDGGGNRTSRVAFGAVAGTTYLIQVDGFYGTSGPAWFGALTLSWR